MGVPAFFRWLEKQCVDITTYCVENNIRVDPATGKKIYPPMTEKNPNGIEYDNFYLDMNGIIHPCSHPEDRPAPRNEEEIMTCIFDNIDRIMNIVRPRKVLYMAIDGVAPRAKMNQQRSRRFRAAKETMISRETKDLLKQELAAKGCKLPGPDPKKMSFDSNCITPGTPFMDRLATCLRFYIYDRLTNHPGWKNIKVILSDASVPGEGEHKIMDYIRHQRGVSGYDPNTKHCIAGADADLIMLGLATHEPWFTILRDEFVPNKPKPCGMCGKMGHNMEDCTGLDADEEDAGEVVFQDTKYIFIHLKVVREWLNLEMDMSEVTGMKHDIENVIDDWVLLCFFVGNDFLPHLPSLEIREGAINKLVDLYKQCVKQTRGYMTKNGRFDLQKVEFIMSHIGQMEDDIFRKRHSREKNFRSRNKRQRDEKKAQENAARQFGRDAEAMGALAKLGDDFSREEKNFNKLREHRARENEKFIESEKALETSSSPVADALRLKKKKQDEEEPADNVCLHEAGWKERYYQSKFNVSSQDEAFRQDLVRCYVDGLAWVLAYYYQGCVSWDWYFPYHYAPFASDFKSLSKIKIEWPLVTIPRKPMEQLMCVFPAASSEFLPDVYANLMSAEDSTIIDFYPTDFKVDLNGKKYEWMGVALLPFVDEARLKRCLKPYEKYLTPNEIHRNTRGETKLFVSKWHPFYEKFKREIFEVEENSELVDSTKFKKITLGRDFAKSSEKGFSGQIAADLQHPEDCETAGFASPMPNECESLKKVCALSVSYRDHEYPKGYEFVPKLLPGVKMPELVGLSKRSRGYGQAVYAKQGDYRVDRDRQMNNTGQSQQRMINNGLGGNRGGRGGYNSRGGDRGGYNNRGGNRGGYNNRDNNRGGHSGNSNSRGGYNNSRGGNNNSHGGNNNSRGGYSNNQQTTGINLNPNNRFQPHSQPYTQDSNQPNRFAPNNQPKSGEPDSMIRFDNSGRGGMRGGRGHPGHQNAEQRKRRNPF